jgi:hypothetical protein
MSGSPEDRFEFQAGGAQRGISSFSCTFIPGAPSLQQSFDFMRCWCHWIALRLPP